MFILEVQAGRSARCAIRAAQALSIILFAPLAVYGAVISGVVHNKTTNQPDAGDEVVLIGLTRNMQELARTRTDATGHYTIDLPDAGMHLIRVDHEKAAYFAPVAPGTTHLDVDVYDVGSKVKGVTTEADTLRLETDTQGLHVVESYFVSNASTPPRTQFGAKAYEIYLPADSQLDSAIAMGPGGMPVASSPVPLGDKGHYAFIFPIRPGETRFQVSYHLPYSGSLSFQPRVSLPTANLAVIVPKSMQFSGGSASFQPVNDDPNAQTFVVRNVQPSQTPVFSISGNGTLPADVSQGQGSSAQVDSSAPTPTASDTRPGIGLGAPIDTPDPLSKYKWWIFTGVGLLLVVGAGYFLRSGSAATSRMSHRNFRLDLQELPLQLRLLGSPGSRKSFSHSKPSGCRTNFPRRNIRSKGWHSRCSSSGLSLDNPRRYLRTILQGPPRNLPRLSTLFPSSMMLEFFIRTGSAFACGSHSWFLRRKNHEKELPNAPRHRSHGCDPGDGCISCDHRCAVEQELLCHDR